MSVTPIEPTGTKVIISEPERQPYVAGPQNVREWDTHMCDCIKDPNFCCFTIWCCCIAACQVSMKLQENCCLGCCTCALGLTAIRTRLRTIYGIEGTICGDCCMATFCTCCALCQMEREMNAIGIGKVPGINA